MRILGLEGRKERTWIWEAKEGRVEWCFRESREKMWVREWGMEDVASHWPSGEMDIRVIVVGERGEDGVVSSSEDSSSSSEGFSVLSLAVDI